MEMPALVISCTYANRGNMYTQFTLKIKTKIISQGKVYVDTVLRWKTVSAIQALSVLLLNR